MSKKAPITIEPRKLAIFSVVFAVVIVVAAVGILVGTNNFNIPTAPPEPLHVNLKVVDKVVDHGTTLCIVEWNGKPRTVFGGVNSVAASPCPVPIGAEIPVLVQENVFEGVDGGALYFDWDMYIWGIESGSD